MFLLWECHWVESVMWLGGRWSLVWVVFMLQAWCLVECDVWVWLWVESSVGVALRWFFDVGVALGGVWEWFIV